MLVFNYTLKYRLFRIFATRKCSDVDGGVAPGDDHGAVELPGPAPDVVRGPGYGQQRIIGDIVSGEKGHRVRALELLAIVGARMPVIGKVVAPETVVIVIWKPNSASMAIAAENRTFNYKQLEKNGLVKKVYKVTLETN